jgi:hypothetical protein
MHYLGHIFVPGAFLIRLPRWADTDSTKTYQVLSAGRRLAIAGVGRAPMTTRRDSSLAFGFWRKLKGLLLLALIRASRSRANLSDQERSTEHGQIF